MSNKLRMLVTSGGTIVPLDEVRRIQNMSSGRFGALIAKAAVSHGCIVDFVYAHNSAAPFQYSVDFSQDRRAFMDILREMIDANMEWDCAEGHYAQSEYKTYGDYQTLVFQMMQHGRPDIVVLAAAVSDYGPASPNLTGKIRSDLDSISIELVRLPKVISLIKDVNPDVFLVGFKLLVNASEQELEDAAMHQIATSKVDLVVANDLSDIKRGNHTLRLYSEEGLIETIQQGDGSRLDVAKKLVENICDYAQ